MEKYRECKVYGKHAYFHEWSSQSKVISPSYLTGGHQGGTIMGTVGIVEFDDGNVAVCTPTEIRFLNPPKKEPEAVTNVINQVTINEVVSEVDNVACEALLALVEIEENHAIKLASTHEVIGHISADMSVNKIREQLEKDIQEGRFKGCQMIRKRP